MNWMELNVRHVRGCAGWLLYISPQMFRALPTHNESSRNIHWVSEWVKVEVLFRASASFPLYFHSANVFWAPNLCGAPSPHDSLGTAGQPCQLWLVASVPCPTIQGQGLGCLPPNPLPTQSPPLIPADAATTPVKPLAWCWQSHKEKGIILSPVT